MKRFTLRVLGGTATLALVAALALTTRAQISPPSTAPSATTSGASAPAASGDHFLAIASVLQSPRCRNCHPADGAPHIRDDFRKHGMNVSRKSPNAGLPCITCHRSTNAPMLHGPPGVTNWHMPPDETPMVFVGLSPHDLCVQLKDSDKNGGKSLAELREHFAKDPFVLWGWNPGEGRTKPPITHAELVSHVDAWIAQGAPCPN